MSRRNNSPIPPISLDQDSEQPLYQQLYAALRKAILEGILPAGSALYSSRRLAETLGISRTTVIEAYAQLIAEGYLEGRPGAATYVTAVLPDSALRTHQNTSPASSRSSTARTFSKRGEIYQPVYPNLNLRPTGPLAFPVGIPAVDVFPFTEWRKLVSQCYRNVSPSFLGYGASAGYRPLREAISTYLKLSRAVNCTPDQILIVTGTQQAIDLTARLLLDVGDQAWIEDPGYIAARRALMGAGAIPVPVPVDGEGIDVATGIAACESARLAYVTPSHQFPLGMTMKLSRRLALLEWANRVGAWIIEDDYDSELRFTGHPLPSLQGLDTGGRVIYVGTFNKVLFPSLRIGYMVIPCDLIDAFAFAHTLIAGQVAILDQMVLTRYISEGYFERHIRRMRVVYAQRQAVLVDQAQALHGILEVSPTETGMHVVGWLPDGTDDAWVAQMAIRNEIYVPPLSLFSMQPLTRKGILMGYGYSDVPTIQHGIAKLNALLRTEAHNP